MADKLRRRRADGSTAAGKEVSKQGITLAAGAAQVACVVRNEGVLALGAYSEARLAKHHLATWCRTGPMLVKLQCLLRAHFPASPAADARGSVEKHATGLARSAAFIATERTGRTAGGADAVIQTGVRYHEFRIVGSIKLVSHPSRYAFEGHAIVKHTERARLLSRGAH
ncbi:MAG: hypothetical protein ABL907_18495 [Hyphomicrobium sp.]